VACRVDLAAFNSTRAVYNLHYTTKTMSRQWVYTEMDTNPDGVGNAVSAPLLTSIDLPGSAGSYTAVYDIGLESTGPVSSAGLTSNDAEIPDLISDPAGGVNPGSYTGHIISLRLPTKAVINWTYQSYVLGIPPSPVVEPSGGNGFVGVTNRAAGVKTRSVEVDGHTDTWTYDSQGLPGPRVSVTSVTEPVTQTRTLN